MDRFQIQIDPNWRQENEKLGFLFHTTDNIIFWNESVYYTLNQSDIKTIQKFSNEIYSLCNQAIDKIIQKNWFYRLGISQELGNYIKKSWESKSSSIYMRLDLSFHKNLPPKLYEIEGDVPVTIFESSVVQKAWLRRTNKSNEQFNFIEDELILYWNELKLKHNFSKVHFTSSKSLENYTNVRYLMETAQKSNIETEFVFINQIGWDFNKKKFVDNKFNKIETIFKLYPWRWLLKEPFSQFIVESNTQWIEPIWKFLCSNKGFLAILWELFPEHPYLIPTYFEQDFRKNRSLFKGKVVKKPFLSSTGQNIAIYEDNSLQNIVLTKSGKLEGNNFIIQDFYPLPKFNDKFALIGSWLINGKCVGMGIRESNDLITDMIANFIPHCME
jgi:glutathionylspermidine synthase